MRNAPPVPPKALRDGNRDVVRRRSRRSLASRFVTFAVCHLRCSLVSPSGVAWSTTLVYNRRDCQPRPPGALTCACVQWFSPCPASSSPRPSSSRRSRRRRSRGARARRRSRRSTRRRRWSPMRDGVKLHTNIFVPRGFAGNLPIIMIRTPYGIEGGEATFRGAYAELARDGYIFVHPGHSRALQVGGTVRDAAARCATRRIRRRSTRAPTRTTRSTGCSRTCRTTTGASGCSAFRIRAGSPSIAMLDPHPALKAVSPQASPADMFIGDDFHHNGAFRLSYGFEYAVMMETEQGTRAVRVRRLRHVRLVPQARVARRTSTRSTSTARFRRWNDFVEPSELRRVLAEAGGRAVPRSRHRADAQRRRLVGPGGLLRPDQDLRAAREARHEAPELPRRRPVESRRMERAQRTDSSATSTSAVGDVAGLSARHPGAVLRVLAEGQSAS